MRRTSIVQDYLEKPARFIRAVVVTVLALVAVILAPQASTAQNQSYLPFDKSNVRPQVRLRPLGSAANLRQPQLLAIGVSPVEAHAASDGDTLFKGKDTAGVPWSVQLGTLGCFGVDATLYSADLDRNGIDDLLALIPTCGNGLAPLNHLFTLMFDRTGRPVPFEADGYFEETDHGVFDVADLNGDGKADLLFMNFSDGYWITSVYTARDARWIRVSGLFGRFRYPLFTRFTNEPNHRPTRPRAGRRPFAPDLSQARPLASGLLESYVWANVHQSEDIRLNVRTARRIDAFSPTSWYSSFAIVVDGKGGRRIVMLSANESATRSLLDEITAGKYRIDLYGHRSQAHSSPELLWAFAKE